MHGEKYGCLSPCLFRLRDVHVHLISVKVCVIRRADSRIKPKGPALHYLDTMGHYTHPVQRRLTVEEYYIPVTELPFYHIPGFDQISNGVKIAICKPEPPAIRTDHVVGTAGCVYIRAEGTIPHYLLKLLNIMGSDPYRNGHLIGNRTRDTDLRYREVRVRRNYGTG